MKKVFPCFVLVPLCLLLASCEESDDGGTDTTPGVSSWNENTPLYLVFADVDEGRGISQAAGYNAVSGPNKIVVVNGPSWACSGGNCSAELESWEATTVAETALVIFTTQTHEPLSRNCSFMGGKSAQLHNTTASITLYDAKTAAVIATTVLSGSRCPSAESSSNVDRNICYADISYSEYTNWLRQYVNP